MAFYHYPVEKQLTILDQLITTVQNALALRPNEKLIIQKRRTGPQYYARAEVVGARRVYIQRKNIARASTLAQRDYEKAFLKVANEQKNCLLELASKNISRSASFMYHALADTYESLPEERKPLVSPYVLPDDLYIQAFLATEYEKKGFFDGAPVILTENGERVRSKSEKIIADKLSSMGIPYLYECPLYLKKIGWIHPDFTLLDVRERTTVILEHFGLMQDLSYVAQAMRKVDCYIYDGYVPGDRLLITHEGGTQVLDHESLDLLISHRFSS